ncbi:MULTISPECIES: DUF5134 domain-containing protein [unclassified Streptomyces]|uniref:DUF5134 domain-containing protein n=1 Tax=unclassified Streptomyces TaxID=2593676 RepID=UPI000DC7BE25|nr:MULTISPECIES: DUF5134 domain-containing protein [unclassified Streptomyces]AWZ07015.1 DUF5134 domain-containing protein [Streptomyces sp. ICC4]AWZ14646.1 DUF5134 domain-containing protein [Streptomyces sp. ICC1]
MSLSTSVSAWLLVLLCAVSGAYCLWRAGRSGGGSAAAGEAAMGFGMALMAVPLGTGGGWQGPALGTVFCGAALHALWLLRTGPHHAHHLVGSLTMVYMALAPGAGPGHGHGQGAGLPLLTGLLLLYFAGYVVLGGARLVTVGGAGVPAGAAGPAGSAGSAGAAEVVRACRLTMGMGMLAMLLTM